LKQSVDHRPWTVDQKIPFAPYGVLAIFAILYKTSIVA
jgi:hypothetical protein